MGKKWYVIHIHSGFEGKVKLQLERKLKLANMEEFVSQILIPTENVIEVKAGQKKVSTRKFFPGYILIEMEMNDEIWQLVRNVSGVSGFIGNRKKAVSGLFFNSGLCFYHTFFFFLFSFLFIS